MSKSKKFLFDQNFDEPLALGSSNDLPDEQQQKLDQMLADAFAQGQRAGAAEALQSIESHTLEYLKRLLAQWQKIAQQTDVFANAATQKASATALLAISNLVPAAHTALAISEVEGVLLQTLRRAVELPRLNVYANPDILPPLQARLDTLLTQTGFAGKCLLIADPALGAMDCRLDWGSGGLEHMPTALWRELRQVWQDSLPKILQTGLSAEAEPPKE